MSQTISILNQFWNGNFTLSKRAEFIDQFSDFMFGMNHVIELCIRIYAMTISQWGDSHLVSHDSKQKQFHTLLWQLIILSTHQMHVKSAIKVASIDAYRP